MECKIELRFAVLRSRGFLLEANAFAIGLRLLLVIRHYRLNTIELYKEFLYKEGKKAFGGAR